jgi:hypothetical protein
MPHSPVLLLALVAAVLDRIAHLALKKKTVASSAALALCWYHIKVNLIRVKFIAFQLRPKE